MVENVGNGIPDFTHGLLERARGFGCVGTVRALLVGGLADAADRGEGSIQDTDDLAKRDFFRRFDKGIAAPDSSPTGQQAGAFQREENLFQEFHRDILPFCNFMALEDTPAIGLAQFEQCPEAIFAFLGELHAGEILSSELLKISKNKPARVVIQAR